MPAFPRCKRLAAWLLIIFLMPATWAKTPDRHDVRVLIDISGSMRQNDPQNLRRPALRMLVGLMQSGTRAGVWTFAKWTNPLVPMAEVDKAWKARAIAASEQITSPGQFTDIERILEDATKDWKGPPDTHNRHLVLLTDGMVDVSKEPGESEASRQRIIEKLLPRLQEMGAKAHTIALSERADHELMKKLSTSTGGWYQQVEDADALQRVFLKIFEQVGKPDAVPLKDNRFTVDSSVNEATVLLFRKPGSPDPVLLSPAGEQYTDNDIPAGVAWYRDQGYDLVTISSPTKGEWSLQADVDPDNRVMIVTALKLETSEVPAHIAVGEAVNLTAHLSNRGTLVRRKAFLRLLDVRADAMTSAGTDPQGLNDTGAEGDDKAADGLYGMRYSEKRPFDEVELLFSVESPTFMREKRYRLAVHEPGTLQVEGEGDQAVAKVSLHDVMRDNTEVTVWQQDASGARRGLQEQDGGYALADPEAPVFAQLKGLSKLGNPVERQLGPVYPEGVAPEPEPVPEPETTSEQAPQATSPEPPSDEPSTEADAQQQASDEEQDSMLPVMIFVAVNVLLVIGGLVAWLVIRKRSRAEPEDTLLDEIEADAGAQSKPEQGAGGETA